MEVTVNSSTAGSPDVELSQWKKYKHVNPDKQYVGPIQAKCGLRPKGGGG